MPITIDTPAIYVLRYKSDHGQVHGLDWYAETDSPEEAVAQAIADHAPSDTRFVVQKVSLDGLRDALGEVDSDQLATDRLQEALQSVTAREVSYDHDRATDLAQEIPDPVEQIRTLDVKLGL